MEQNRLKGLIYLKKYTKRIVSLLLSAGMFFSAVPTAFVSSGVVTAANTDAVTEEVHIWDGTSDISWYDDEEAEFHISTPEQLAGFAAIVNTGKTMEGKTFILDNDIYLNDVSGYDEWDTTEPANIWTPAKVFSGTFQGDNHSIIGLYTTSGGMFKEVVNGCISELNLIDLYVSGYYRKTEPYYFNGMVAYSDNSSVINCSVQGKINNNSDNRIRSGGFVGYSVSSKIIGCTNMTEVSGVSNYYVGGVCGSAESTCIVNCINKGNINCSKSYYVGGICGYLTSNAVITNCVNYGDVYENNAEVGAFVDIVIIAKY